MFQGTFLGKCFCSKEVKDLEPVNSLSQTVASILAGFLRLIFNILLNNVDVLQHGTTCALTNFEDIFYFVSFKNKS